VVETTQLIQLLAKQLLVEIPRANAVINFRGKSNVWLRHIYWPGSRHGRN
jgi:hypothetical protein